MLDTRWRSLLLRKILPFICFSVFYTCGKKAPPMPPLSLKPQKIEKLELFQRGWNVIIIFDFPQTTISGLPIKKLSSIEVVWKFIRDFVSGSRVDILQSGQSKEIEGDEISKLIIGEKLFVPLKIEREWVEGTLFLAVRVKAGKEWSDLSEIVRVYIVEPPPKIVSLFWEIRKDGVYLEWVREDEGKIRIYKSTTTRFGKEIEVVSKDNFFLDRDVVDGGSYYYAVSRSIEKEREGVSFFVESDLSVTDRIIYKDIFPPSPPQVKAIYLGEGRVKVSWLTYDKDVESAIVYRKSAVDEVWNKIANVDRKNYFVDEGLGRGMTFFYKVALVDRKGNKGEFSSPVKVYIE